MRREKLEAKSNAARRAHVLVDAHLHASKRYRSRAEAR